MTGRTVEAQRPRHTVEEVAAIFAALPQADPLVLLLVELAAEPRAGQAVRAKRSDLFLAPDFAQDARVLNRLTEHLDSVTRERVYQDPQNGLVRARAAKARREMRRHLNGGGNPSQGAA